MHYMSFGFRSKQSYAIINSMLLRVAEQMASHDLHDVATENVSTLSTAPPGLRIAQVIVCWQVSTLDWRLIRFSCKDGKINLVNIVAAMG